MMCGRMDRHARCDVKALSFAKPNSNQHQPRKKNMMRCFLPFLPNVAALVCCLLSWKGVIAFTRVYSPSITPETRLWTSNHQSSREQQKPTSGGANDLLDRYRNRSLLLESTLQHKVQALKLSDQKLHVLQDAVKRLVAKRKQESDVVRQTKDRTDQHHHHQQDAQTLQQLQMELEDAERRYREKEIHWRSQQKEWEHLVESLRQQQETAQIEFKSSLANIREEHRVELEQNRQDWKTQEKEAVEIAQAAVRAAERREINAETTWSERFEKEQALLNEEIEKWKSKRDQAMEKVAMLEAEMEGKEQTYEQAYSEKVSMLEAQAKEKEAANERSFAEKLAMLEAEMEKKERAYEQDYAEKVAALEAEMENKEQTYLEKVVELEAEIENKESAYKRDTERDSMLEAEVIEKVQTTEQEELTVVPEPRIIKLETTRTSPRELVELVDSQHMKRWSSEKRPGRVRRLASRLLRRDFKNKSP